MMFLAFSEKTKSMSAGKISFESCALTVAVEDGVSP